MFIICTTAGEEESAPTVEDVAPVAEDATMAGNESKTTVEDVICRAVKYARTNS